SRSPRPRGRGERSTSCPARASAPCSARSRRATAPRRPRARPGRARRGRCPGGCPRRPRDRRGARGGTRAACARARGRARRGAPEKARAARSTRPRLPPREDIPFARSLGRGRGGILVSPGVCENATVKRATLAAAGLALANLALAVFIDGRTSATWDEPAYLASGLSYVATRDYRMKRDAPILPGSLGALATVGLGSRLPLDDPSWEKGDEWTFATVFLNERNRPIAR